MLITGDLVRGGLPRTDPKQYEEMKEKCICDGQLSEALVCRGNEYNSTLNTLLSTDYGYCTESPTFRFTIERNTEKFLPVPQTICGNEIDSRPRLIIMTFGLFIRLWEFKGVQNLQRIIDSALEQQRTCNHQFAMYFIFTSVEPELEPAYKKFPAQSEGTIADYNAAISNYIHSLPSNYNITFINTTNILSFM
jgi:hypothetical protein